MPWLLSKLLQLQRASSGGACSGTSLSLSLLLPPKGQPLAMAERQCWDHQFPPCACARVPGCRCARGRVSVLL